MANLNEKLSELKQFFHEQLHAQNGSITIRHISVIQQNLRREEKGYEPRGEYDSHSMSLPESKDVVMKETRSHLLQRILDYINQLAQHAERIHRQDNVDANTQEILPEKLNSITRLSLHEFGLYPDKDQQPFSIEEFNEICRRVNGLAQNYSSNLQLLLGTLPVIVEGKIKNTGLFVQCGREARVNAFSKKNNYSDSSNNHHDPYYDAKYSYPVTTDELLIEISEGCHLKYTTLGGAECNLVVDICGDFYGKVSYNLTHENLKKHLRHQQTFFPMKAEHIILSNVLDINCDKSISEKVFIVDPHHSNTRSNYSNIVDQPQHEYMNAHSVEQTTDLDDPIFGSVATLIHYKQETIDAINDYDTQNKINFFNRMLLKLLPLKSLIQFAKEENYPAETISKIYSHYTTLLDNIRNDNFAKANIDFIITLTKNIEKDHSNLMTSSTNVVKRKFAETIRNKIKLNLTISTNEKNSISSPQSDLSLTTHSSNMTDESKNSPSSLNLFLNPLHRSFSVNDSQIEINGAKKRIIL